MEWSTGTTQTMASASCMKARSTVFTEESSRTLRLETARDVSLVTLRMACTRKTTFALTQSASLTTRPEEVKRWSTSGLLGIITEMVCSRMTSLLRTLHTTKLAQVTKVDSIGSHAKEKLLLVAGPTSMNSLNGPPNKRSSFPSLGIAATSIQGSQTALSGLSKRLGTV